MRRPIRALGALVFGALTGHLLVWLRHFDGWEPTNRFPSIHPLHQSSTLLPNELLISTVGWCVVAFVWHLPRRARTAWLVRAGAGVIALFTTYLFKAAMLEPFKGKPDPLFFQLNDEALLVFPFFTIVLVTLLSAPVSGARYVKWLLLPVPVFAVAIAVSSLAQRLLIIGYSGTSFDIAGDAVWLMTTQWGLWLYGGAISTLTLKMIQRSLPLLPALAAWAGAMALLFVAAHQHLETFNDALALRWALDSFAPAAWLGGVLVLLAGKETGATMAPALPELTPRLS